MCKHASCLAVSLTRMGALVRLEDSDEGDDDDDDDEWLQSIARESDRLLSSCCPCAITIKRLATYH